MKRFLAFTLLILLAACTSQPPTAEVAQPEFVEVEPVPLAFAEVGYKTPKHLRSTGGGNCAPLPEAGVATLECNFVRTTPEGSPGVLILELNE